MCFSQPVLTELPRPKWMEEPNLCIYRSFMRKCQDNCYVTNLFKPPVRATGYYLSPPYHGRRSAEPKNSPNVQSGAQGWSQQQKAKGTVHPSEGVSGEAFTFPFCFLLFNHFHPYWFFVAVLQVCKAHSNFRKWPLCPLLVSSDNLRLIFLCI